MTNKVKQRIFLSSPHMGGQELEYVREAFDSNYIAPLGPMVDKFEQAFSNYTGIPHCVAVNSGTAAMHLALRHIGIGSGDVVMASTFTFIGSVTPILFQSATPVFIDCSPDTWGMDPGLLESAIHQFDRQGRRPKAIIPTDLYGQCCDMDAIREIGGRIDIPVVVDAAEAVGSTYKGRHAGSGARAAVFSFNGNKIMTTSGGGMLASDDEEMIVHARKLSQQARDPFPHYEHTEYGYNYRMSNILAAIGLGQLEVLDEHIQRRRDIGAIYKKLLGSLPGISFMPEASYGVGNQWLSVIMVDPAKAGIDREALRMALEKENIESRPVWKPMHLQPVFKDSLCVGGHNSEVIFNHGLCLPSGSNMKDDDVVLVCAIIRGSLNGK